MNNLIIFSKCGDEQDNLACSLPHFENITDYTEPSPSDRGTLQDLNQETFKPGNL